MCMSMIGAGGGWACTRGATSSVGPSATAARQARNGSHLDICPSGGAAHGFTARPAPPARAALFDLGAEVFDGLDQPFLELHFRLPPEERSRAGDVGTPLLGIVGGQRLVDDLAGRAG